MALDFVFWRVWKSPTIDATASGVADMSLDDDALPAGTWFSAVSVLVLGDVLGVTVQPTLRVNVLGSPGGILAVTALTLAAGNFCQNIPLTTVNPVLTVASAAATMQAEIVGAAVATQYRVRVWALGLVDSDF